VCCSVLQRVAACCSVLQRVAVCCTLRRQLYMTETVGLSSENDSVVKEGDLWSCLGGAGRVVLSHIDIFSCTLLLLRAARVLLY